MQSELILKEMSNDSVPHMSSLVCLYFQSVPFFFSSGAYDLIEKN